MLCATVIGAATACAVGAVAVQRYVRKCRRWGRALEILQELEEKCATPTWKLKRIADAMNVEMHAGLASEGGSKLKMLITYVDKLPTGYYSILFFLQSTILFNLFIILLITTFFDQLNQFPSSRFSIHESTGTKVFIVILSRCC